jgi:hypothetical protein
MKIAYGMTETLTTYALVDQAWLEAQSYPSPGLTHGGLRSSPATMISATYDTWLDFDLALSILEQQPEMSNLDFSSHVEVRGRHGHEVLMEVQAGGLDRFVSSLRTSPMAWISNRQRDDCLTFRSRHLWGRLGDLASRRALLLGGAIDDAEGGDILRHEAERVVDEAIDLFRGFWGSDPSRPEIERLLAAATRAPMPEYPGFAGAFALWLLPAIARGEDERLFAMHFAELAYMIEATHRRLAAGRSEVLVCLAGFYDKRAGWRR